MKKMKNKGFALVETLIVSAFVMGIFSLVFANFYPMMGEYEKRENYDDISSIYHTNLFKRLIEKNKDYGSLKTKINDVAGSSSTKNYQQIAARDFPDGTGDGGQGENLQEYFKILAKNMDVYSEDEENYDYGVAIYLTKYNISEFKSSAKSIFPNDIQTLDYINYLPEYKNNKYGLGCRIIIKYRAGGNKESDNASDEFKYATIGVDCL